MDAIQLEYFARNAEVSNNSSYHHRDDVNGSGYAPLDRLLPKQWITKDACELRIKFHCEDDYNMFRIAFVFGSDDTLLMDIMQIDDIMGIFINGLQPYRNIATAVIGGMYHRRDVVFSVNTLFRGRYYVDNQRGQYETSMNGFTKPRVADGCCRPGENVRHLAVRDGGKRRSRDVTRNGNYSGGAYLMISKIWAEPFRTTPPPGECDDMVFDKAKCSCTYIGPCVDNNARMLCNPPLYPSIESQYRKTTRNIYWRRRCRK